MEYDPNGRFVAARNAWERRRKQNENSPVGGLAALNDPSRSPQRAGRSVMRRFGSSFGRATPAPRGYSLTPPASPPRPKNPNNQPGGPRGDTPDKMYRPEIDGPKKRP